MRRKRVGIKWSKGQKQEKSGEDQDSKHQSEIENYK